MSHILLVLSIVTANIRIDLPGDPVPWTGRIEPLAQVLMAPQPDIIGTQEGWHSQIEDLSRELSRTGMRLVDRHRKWLPNRVYPSLFVRSDKFHIVGSGDLWLSQAPFISESKLAFSQYPRLMTWAKLVDQSSQLPLLVVNTHLDHLFSFVRVEQVKILMGLITQLNVENARVILMGDFNENPAGNVRAAVDSGYLKFYDPWQRLHQPEVDTYNGWGHWFQGLKSGRIDWVLLHGHFNVVEARRMDMQITKPNGETFFASDHYPISLKVSY